MLLTSIIAAYVLLRCVVTASDANAHGFARGIAGLLALGVALLGAVAFIVGLDGFSQRG